MKTIQLLFAVVIGLAVGFMAAPVKAATGYVAQAGQTPAAPYTNWAGAASNVQDAVAVAANALVLVSNGTYTVTNAISITNTVVLLSVNGAANTTLRGSGAAIRIITIASGATNTVLDGFTVSGGNSAGGSGSLGGGIYAGAANSVIRNCIIRGNYHNYGGGAVATYADCVISNCFIISNSAAYYGGGVIFRGGTAQMVNCVLAGNEVGAASGPGGGGACAFPDASAKGIIVNCTITGNKNGDSASTLGGGVCVYGGGMRLVNSIVYDNSPNDYGSSGGSYAWTNSCASPLPSGGTNNISANPRFVNGGAGYGLSRTGGDYHLLGGSPCIDTGTNAGAPSTDIEGSVRPMDGNGDGTTNYDMGAYEAPTAYVGGSFTTVSTPGFVPQPVVFSSTAWGNTNGLYYRWVFGDGNTTNGAGLAVVTNIYTAYGSYSPMLMFSNNAGQVYSFYGATLLLMPRTIYVATNGGNVYPYGAWSNAATNVQTAINAATLYDGTNWTEIVVSNGTYTSSNSIMIATGVKLRSLNGAANTILRTTGTTNVVTLAANLFAAGASIDGFTITGGNAAGGAGMNGGGIYAGASKSAIRNCIIRGNYHNYGGGGVATYADCVISNCLIISNSAAYYGGGVIFRGGNAQLVNCVLAGNSCGSAASSGGGGALSLGGNGTFQNCTITGNQTANYTSFGGGVCTFNSTIRLMNSIVYGNRCDGAATDNYNQYGGVLSFTNCCALPLPAGGTNNISSDPKFLSAGSGFGLSHSNGNYHLTRSSPCVNAGTNQAWMTNNSVDLDGNHRIFMQIVDMGAYELPPPQGTVLSIR